MILSDITILASTILFFAVTIILGCIDTFSRDTARCKKISCPIRQCENHDKRQNGC